MTKDFQTIYTKEAFSEFVSNIQSVEGYKNPIGFGICRVDLGQKDSSKVLQATYPLINWKENYGSSAVFLSALDEAGIDISFSDSEAVYPITEDFVEASLRKFTPFISETKTGGEAHKNIQVVDHLKGRKDLHLFRVVFIFEDTPLKSVEATYLKLYALSQKKTPLRSLNLNGAFGVLHNVAWSGNRPYELDWLRENEIEMKIFNMFPNIDSVDKFPRFLQHVIPENNTRILDASKVRMGAQLAAGTTVMPGASYINFNAGTTGVSMVEGRISSSAIVGDGSDVGGGASILGVLSGTNGNPISIGKNTLLGANSVTGIPLGDGCIVDAGIAILEGTKVAISENELKKLQELNSNLGNQKSFKGKDLAGINGCHFRQNSENGQITAFRSKREVKLNEELH
jgi:2,3,4,5-tetrahydropyridine-2-carboxylate N-succinyltransferase